MDLIKLSALIITLMPFSIVAADGAHSAANNEKKAELSIRVSVLSGAAAAAALDIIPSKTLSRPPLPRDDQSWGEGLRAYQRDLESRRKAAPLGIQASEVSSSQVSK